MELNWSEEELLNHSLAELLRGMWEHTDRDGSLTLPDLTAAAQCDPPCKLVCRMEWTEQNCAEVTEEFTRLAEGMKEIGEAFAKASADAPDEADADRIPERLKNDLWNKYAAPFDLSGFPREQVTDMMERSAIGIPLKKEQKKLRDRYVAEMTRQANRRLGDGLFAYETVVFAARVMRLHQLHAPAQIIHINAAGLAQSLALFRFARQVKKVPLPEPKTP